MLGIQNLFFTKGSFYVFSNFQVRVRLGKIFLNGQIIYSKSFVFVRVTVSSALRQRYVIVTMRQRYRPHALALSLPCVSVIVTIRQRYRYHAVALSLPCASVIVTMRQRYRYHALALLLSLSLLLRNCYRYRYRYCYRYRYRFRYRYFCVTVTFTIV